MSDEDTGCLRHDKVSGSEHRMPHRRLSTAMYANLVLGARAAANSARDVEHCVGAGSRGKSFVGGDRVR